MQLTSILACALAAAAAGDQGLAARRSVSLNTAQIEQPPTEDMNEETHFHEEHPEIWKHEMPFSIEATFALMWITMIAAVPLILPIMDRKPITNTQMTLSCLMWTALFGGVYLFTHIIKFNSAHFATTRCLTLVECIYLMAQVITTVGYGDITPAYPRGQVFVALYVIASMLVIAMLVSDLADSLIQKAAEYERKLALKAEEDAMAARRGRRNYQEPTKSPSLLISIPPPSATPIVRAVIIFAVFAACGIVFWHEYPGEGKTWFQAVYMSIITLSTVGFGAFTPATEAGKVFGAFWMVFGCSALVNVVSSFTEFMVNMNEYERYDGNHAMGPFIAYKQELGVDRVDKLTFLKLALVHKGVGSAEDVDGLCDFFKSLGPDQKDGCLDLATVKDKMMHNTHPAMMPVHHLRKKGGGSKMTARKSPR